MAELFVQVPADGVGKKVRTIEQVVGANTVEQEVIVIGDATSANLATVNASSRLAVSVDNTPAVTISGTPAARPSDGTNLMTTMFDADTGAGTQWIQGVSPRKAASGGSVEYGTSTDPVRTDPTGTTIQPISGTVTANAGTNLNTSALALDASVAGLSLTQGATTAGQKAALVEGAVTTAAPTYTTGNSNPLSLNTTGGLRVDGSGVTQPVSGTVTANAGTGSFTVAQATAANLNATITGTVTANAGTGNFNVVGTKSSNGGAPGATNLGTLPAVANAAAPTFTEGNQVALSTDLSGALRVSGSAGGGVAQTQVRNSGDTAWVNVGPAAANAKMPATIYSSGGTELATSGAPLRTDPTGTTTQPVSGTVTANAGTGSFTVAQATAANLNATVAQGTAAAGTAGWPVVHGNVTAVTAAWTSATALNTTLSIATTGYTTAVLTFSGTSTLTAGGLIFEASADGGTNWYPLPLSRTDVYTTENTYTVSVTTQAWDADVGGFSNFRVRLNPVITGTGTVSLRLQVSADATDPDVVVGQSVASNLNAQAVGNVASAAADSGNPIKIGGIFNTTQPTVTTGQRVDAQMTARGAQIVAAGVEALNVTVNAALPTGSNVIGALSANQSVNVAQINAVTPLMGNGVTGTGSPRTTLASDNSAIANWGQGATAAAVPSGAIYNGARAATANPTAATGGNLTGVMVDKLGRTVVVPGHVRDLVTRGSATISTTTETSVIAAGGAGVFHDITAIVIANTSATGVRVDIRDVSAGTVQFSMWAPATQTIGAVFQVPLTQTTANSAWTAQLSAAVTDVRVLYTAVKNV